MSREDANKPRARGKKKYKTNDFLDFIKENFHENYPEKKNFSDDYYLFILEILHFTLKDKGLDEQTTHNIVTSAKHSVNEKHLGYKAILKKINELLETKKFNLVISLEDCKTSLKNNKANLGTINYKTEKCPKCKAQSSFFKQLATEGIKTNNVSNLISEKTEQQSIQDLLKTIQKQQDEISTLKRKLFDAEQKNSYLKKDYNGKPSNSSELFQLSPNNWKSSNSEKRQITQSSNNEVAESLEKWMKKLQ